MVPDIAMATSGGKMEFWEEVGWKFVFPSRHPRGGIKVTEPDEITWGGFPRRMCHPGGMWDISGATQMNTWNSIVIIFSILEKKIRPRHDGDEWHHILHGEKIIRYLSPSSDFPGGSGFLSLSLFSLYSPRFPLISPPQSSFLALPSSPAPLLYSHPHSFSLPGRFRSLWPPIYTSCPLTSCTGSARLRRKPKTVT